MVDVRLLRALVALQFILATSVGAQDTPTGSYLKVPRVHFSGDFFCDVSTVNNNPLNYQPDVTDPEPWWNPDGTHATDFRDCVVTAIYDDAGVFVHQPSVDPLAGASIETSTSVLVDLDTDQQGVSMFFDLDVSIVMPVPGRATPLTITGPMDPAGLNGLWWQVMPVLASGRGGDFNASASYQSVVRFDPSAWPASSGSPALDALRAGCDRDAEGKLMMLIAFTTNAYQDSDVNRGFKVGRVSGTLAARAPGEPIHTPGQRWLKPRAWNPEDPEQVAYPPPSDPKDAQQRWDYQVFNGGPFFVDETRKRLVVDLGNSLPIQRVADRATDDGSYTDVSAVSGVSAYVAHGNQRTELGRVDVSAFGQLETAGISEVPLTDAQIALLRDHPLQLIAEHINSGDPAILAEAPDGLDFAVTERVFRMANDIPPSETPLLGTLKRATSSLYVTRWGRPAEGIAFRGEGQNLHDGSSINSGGAFTWSVEPSDANGVAAVVLEATGDPGSRTTELDGQQWQVTFSIDLPGPADDDAERPRLMKLTHGMAAPFATYSDPLQERSISVHQYAAYAVRDDPAWSDVERIMSPYMKIYPSMRERIDLSVEDTFIFYSLQPPGGTPPIPLFMNAPFGSSGYMPITRDLSPNKHRTVMNYIDNLPPQTGEGR